MWHQMRHGVRMQAFGVFPTGTLRPGETYPWSEDLDFRVFKGRVAKGAALFSFTPLLPGMMIDITSPQQPASVDATWHDRRQHLH